MEQAGRADDLTPERKCFRIAQPQSTADHSRACVNAWTESLPSSIALRRDEVDLAASRLWVRRLKNGLSVEQPMAGDELRATKRYLATRGDELPWLFVSERGAQMTRQAINHLLIQAAARAGLSPVNPHMLRHSCGFALANRGYDLRLIQDYLGHRDPKHTVRYTRTAARRFEGLWR